MGSDRSRWWALGFAALMAIGSMGTAAAQAPDVLTELLAEVRGLRAAMEQLASASPRVQLAMGRLQLQEQRINTMVRRLDDVRDRLAAAERQAGERGDQLAHFEKALGGRYSGEEQEQIKAQITEVKRELERAGAEVARLRQEESDLTAAVAQEQARWVEINGALNELDRALGPRR